MTELLTLIASYLGVSMNNYWKHWQNCYHVFKWRDHKENYIALQHNLIIQQIQILKMLVIKLQNEKHA